MALKIYKIKISNIILCLSNGRSVGVIRLRARGHGVFFYSMSEAFLWVSYLE
jgi:hypothetical protein